MRNGSENELELDEPGELDESSGVPNESDGGLESGDPNDEDESSSPKDDDDESLDPKEFDDEDGGENEEEEDDDESNEEGALLEVVRATSSVTGAPATAAPVGATCTGPGSPARFPAANRRGPGETATTRRMMATVMATGRYRPRAFVTSPMVRSAKLPIRPFLQTRLEADPRVKYRPQAGFGAFGHVGVQ